MAFVVVFVFREERAGEKALMSLPRRLPATARDVTSQNDNINFPSIMQQQFIIGSVVSVPGVREEAGRQPPGVRLIISNIDLDKTRTG